MENEIECLMIIVNSGFTDVVMDAARKEGARGGTILHAKGTGSIENEKFFGISITPDKEIVLILCKKEDSEKILLAVNQVAGLATSGNGIGFSIPVSDVVGINFNSLQTTIKENENQEKSEDSSDENNSNNSK